MLIIFESPDQTGKTEFAKRLAEDLSLHYVKLKNIMIDDNIKIESNVSLSTHSQLETVTQLFEKGVLKDAVLDRFHISEFVYDSLFHRKYNTDYLHEINDRLSKFNDVFIIRLKCNEAVLKSRWSKNELLLTENQLANTINYYNVWFRRFNTIPVIEIDTTNFNPDIAYANLIKELYNRAIFKSHLRDRRWTHEEVMMNIAKTISRRSPDISRQVGAVLTEDGFIIGVGYNGPPSGFDHDVIDIRKEKGFASGKGLEYSRSIHAEQNAIMQSGLRSKTKGKLELFCTTSPCIHCTRMLLQIGVSKIYYLEKYNDEMAEIMWKESGIEVIKVE